MIPEPASDRPTTQLAPGWLPLSGVAQGVTARLRECDLQDSDRDLLTGLGLIADRRFLVCKTGSPCIVQVRGVRVGLSRAIAERLLVELVDESLPASSLEQ